MAQRYASWDRQEELWHSWRDYLMRWQWEWRVTLTLPDTLRPRYSRAMFYAWLRNIQNTERMNLAGYVFGCFSHRHLGSKYRHLHLHVLLLGRSRNTGSDRTLSDVSRWRWRDRWQQIVQQRMRLMFGPSADVFGGIAKVLTVDDNYEACSYHGQQFMGYKNSKVEHESFGYDLLLREVSEVPYGGDSIDDLLDEDGPVIGAE